MVPDLPGWVPGRIRSLIYRVEKWWIQLLLPARYALSSELREAHERLVTLIRSSDLPAADPAAHRSSASRAIAAFRLQREADVPEIYRPGEMWGNIIASISTFSTWRKTGDDSVLAASLSRFYRTDLVTAHSGDMYIWDLEKGNIDLMLQVYMIIRRYREFLPRHPRVDPSLVSTTDVGRNIYVLYRGRKLTFKTLRHACYLDRMQELGLIGKAGGLVGELGCGSGEMAILAKKMHPGTRYVCFDLPETLLVSTYNVLASLPGLSVGLVSDFPGTGRITRKELERFDIVMLPNWCIGRMEDGTFDLFVNIASLSEMPLPIIRNYIGEIERVTAGSFYTVNRNRPGVAQWGAEDVPISAFPFSANARITSMRYDTASDIYHIRYGLDYVCNYWEAVVAVGKPH
ncbi:MAG TPA: putative sugar O-methyltransferase [Methanomicrobiales archaeon]|nr:putative sugar O-methyltransferase [Methanomicrobiales archaeon]